VVALPGLGFQIGMGATMDRIPGPILVSLTFLMLATLAELHAAEVARPTTVRSPEDDLGSSVLPPPDNGAEKTPRRKNLLIIGASSLIGPMGQPQVVGALLESKGIPMDVEGKFWGTDTLDGMLSSKKVWDYVIMDAWQFRRGGTDPPEFPNAVAVFMKQVRAHSPSCKIILFPWWIPRGPDATNEGVMKVFHRCVEAARPNDIWVATTGPAFMEARLKRPDLHVTVSEQDAHPGIHGTYINACSLFTILTGESPAGLPATLKIPGRKKDLSIAPDDAKYLQELAWKVYRREIKNTKPAR
jgi:hypothetical protein